jgi:hypothetical protein
MRRALPFRLHPAQLLGMELVLLALLPLGYLVTGGTLEAAAAGRSGGLVAWALATPVRDYLGGLLTAFLYLALLASGVTLVARWSWHDATHTMRRISTALQRWAHAPGATIPAGSASAGARARRPARAPGRGGCCAGRA